MARSRKEDVKSKGERQQVILRLVQEHPISSRKFCWITFPKRDSR